MRMFRHNSWIVDSLLIALALLLWLAVSPTGIPPRIEVPLDSLHFSALHNLSYDASSRTLKATGEDPYGVFDFGPDRRPVQELDLTFKIMPPKPAPFSLYYLPQGQNLAFNESARSTEQPTASGEGWSVRWSLPLQAAKLRLDPPDRAEVVIESLSYTSGLGSRPWRTILLALLGFAVVLRATRWMVPPDSWIAWKRRVADAPVAYGVLGLVGLKLWLLQGQQYMGLGLAAHDDALFIRLAGEILGGNWLGAYNNVTLSKGPGFPLWIAFSCLIGLPLHVSATLLYAAACALLAQAVKPAVPSPSLRLALFAIVFFEPMSHGGGWLRFTRDMVYPAQSLMVIAALFGLIARSDRSFRRMLPWAVILGLSAGFFWITREEGVYLVPAALVGYGIAGFRLWRKRPRDFRFATGAFALGPAVAGLIVCAVAMQNYRVYGIFTICEFKHPDFVSAYGSLLRVQADRPQRYVPVPKDVRLRLYEVSPAFSELKPSLEGDLASGWRHASVQGMHFSESESGGEVYGGWYAWLLRDAVQAAGYYKDGPSAMAFYRRLHEEINAACDAGKLSCSPRHDSMASPWRPEYLLPVLAALKRGLSATLTFQYASFTATDSAGPTRLLLPFSDLSNDRLAPASRILTQPSSRERLDQLKMDILELMAKGYAMITSYWFYASLGLFPILLAWPALRRQARLLPLTVMVTTAIATRLALLAYIDATAFPAINSLYLAPLYPLPLVFAGALSIDCALAVRNALAGRRIALLADVPGSPGGHPASRTTG
jgi:hypothetical protein